MTNSDDGYGYTMTVDRESLIMSDTLRDSLPPEILGESSASEVIGTVQFDDGTEVGGTVLRLERSSPEWTVTLRSPKWAVAALIEPRDVLGVVITTNDEDATERLWTIAEGMETRVIIDLEDADYAYVTVIAARPPDNRKQAT